MRQDARARTAVCAVAAAIFGGASLLAGAAAQAALVDFTGAGTDGAALTTINAGGNTLTFTNAVVAVEGSSPYGFRGPPPSAQQDDRGTQNPFNLAGNVFFSDRLFDPARSPTFAYTYNPVAGVTLQGVPNFGRPSGPILVDFALPVSGLSFIAGDIDCSNPDQALCGTADPRAPFLRERVSASVFGPGNTLLETITVNWNSPGAGDGLSTLFQFSATGITRLELVLSNEGGANGVSAVGFDNLGFTTIPEPGTYALLGAGLLALLATARRRAR